MSAEAPHIDVFEQFGSLHEANTGLRGMLPSLSAS